jgi:hypothetical protein
MELNDLNFDLMTVVETARVLHATREYVACQSERTGESTKNGFLKGPRGRLWE